MRPDALQPADAEGEHAKFVLEPAELQLNRSVLVVLRLEPCGLPRDQRVQSGAFTQTDAGWHSPDGHRHFNAPRFTSDPAYIHVPCPHFGGAASI